MEGFLRRHGGLRTTLLLGLLLGIVIEGFLIYTKVGSATIGNQGTSPEVQGETAMSCVVRSDVHLRTGPSVDYEIVTTLHIDDSVQASAQNGDTPWLLLRTTDGREGWSSTWSGAGVRLIECEGDISVLPEQAVENPPEATEIVIEPTAVQLLPPPDQVRSDNGPDLHVVGGIAATIDGELSEWGNATWAPISNVLFRSENWAGQQDLSGQVAATWSAERLIFAVSVTDDFIVQDAQDEEFYKGDSIEFFIDRDLVGDFDVTEYNGDDIQGVVTAGNFADREPAARVWVPTGNNFANEMEIAAERTDEGYTIEFSMPWSRIGVVPRPGAYFGYAIALSDDDTGGAPEQETQMSTSTRLPYPTPPNWGNMILQP